MALSIKNDEADRLARALTEITGESLTEAVVVSLRERLRRKRTELDSRPIAERLMERGARYSRLPSFDDRADDEIVGYDDHGLPT